jgi:hypothetical protein
LFGIDLQTNELFWDGQKLAFARRFELTFWQAFFAIVASVGTFGSFAIELGKVIGWWSK